MSLRSSERGLKYIIFGSNFGRCIVAPFVGAWIEMGTPTAIVGMALVAPFVGAWIEMYKSLPIDLTDFVAPFVGAWIEMQLKRVMLI